MKLGIVGLTNVGKSTLFNALTGAGAQSANYPFSTVKPNIGVVPVPDPRLHELNKIYNAKSVIPTAIEFVDIAGLARGASKGEGLGNQFLAHIREVDAIVHVVRCFEDDDVTHDGEINPAADIEAIGVELILADMDLIEKRLSKAQKGGKHQVDKVELSALQKLSDALGEGKKATEADLDAEELAYAAQFCLLTLKPVLYAANVSEDDAAGTGAHAAAVREIAEAEGSGMFAVCAKSEEELSDLPEDERAEYLAELGVSGSGLAQLIEASYKLLGLISFLTVGPKEVRAWTIKEGTTAPGAAGKIHSDLERGFIRAEVVTYEDLLKYGSQPAAREAGLLRSEGKAYVVKDGDVILFRFNV